MYGCECESPDDDIACDDLYDATRNFRGKVSGGTADDIVGLWIAVGASGKAKAADFNYPCIPLSAAAFKRSDDFGGVIEDAEADWPKFIKHVETKAKFKIRGKPKLWIVSTEVA